MLTIVVNLAGGSPVTIPGYTYGTEAECKAQIYTPVIGWINKEQYADPVTMTHAVCVPMDFNMQTPDGE
jgi:hypothetical protein